MENSNLRVCQIYDTNRFNESETSHFKNVYNSCKKRFVRKIKDPSFYKKLGKSRFPILEWLPNYKIHAFLLADLVAGLTVGVMNIPQGMAYALLASLPAVHGLYIAFFPCIFYALFGTSPHLAIGAIALVSLLSGTAISQASLNYEMNMNTTGLNATDVQDELSSYRVSVAMSLTLLVGVIQILLGASGLGILTSYFSDTFISSYTCGSAIHVIKSQLKDLLGITNSLRFSGLFNIQRSLVDLITKLPDSNWRTVILSLICIVYLFIFKEYINPIIKKKIKVQFPSELLLVIVATSVSHLAKFESYAITVVGEVPNGFPIPEVPTTSLWPDLLVDAFIIALIAFSINISMACLFARKHKYDIDSTQELYAYGIANIFSSFFHCFPSAASLSRSSVLEGAGGKTMLSAIFNALILLLVILFIGPLFESLPKACLASIIVVAFKNLLLQVKDVVTLWRVNKFESITWLITFLSVVLLNVDYGLVIGVLVSNLMLVLKDQFFKIKPFTSYNDSDDFVDTSFIIDTKPIENSNLKIYKIQRSIHFANCNYFQKSLFKLYGFSPLDRSRTKQFEVKFVENSGVSEKMNSQNNNMDGEVSFSTVIVKKDPEIILDMSAVNYVDTNGVKCIVQVVEDFRKIGVNVYLCQSQDSLIEIMYHMNVLKKLDDNIYISIHDAITAISNRNLDTNPKFENEILV